MQAVKHISLRSLSSLPGSSECW